jgi:hypothetical protein
LIEYALKNIFHDLDSVKAKWQTDVPAAVVDKENASDALKDVAIWIKTLTALSMQVSEQIRQDFIATACKAMLCREYAL